LSCPFLKELIVSLWHFSVTQIRIAMDSLKQPFSSKNLGITLLHLFSSPKERSNRFVVRIAFRCRAGHLR
jgi:hypothetical protein